MGKNPIFTRNARASHGVARVIRAATEDERREKHQLPLLE